MATVYQSPSEIFSSILFCRALFPNCIYFMNWIGVFILLYIAPRSCAAINYFAVRSRNNVAGNIFRRCYPVPPGVPTVWVTETAPCWKPSPAARSFRIRLRRTARAARSSRRRRSRGSGPPVRRDLETPCTSWGSRVGAAIPGRTDSNAQRPRSYTPCDGKMFIAYFQCSPDIYFMIAGNITDLIFIRDNLHVYHFTTNELAKWSTCFVLVRLSISSLWVSCSLRKKMRLPPALEACHIYRWLHFLMALLTGKNIIFIFKRAVSCKRFIIMEVRRSRVATSRLTWKLNYACWRICSHSKLRHLYQSLLRSAVSTANTNDAI